MPDKTLKFFLLGLFCFFALTFVVLGFYFFPFRFGGIGFLNLRGDLALEVDEQKFETVRPILERTRGKILFVLSPKLKEIEDRAAGHANSDKGSYFAEYKRLGPIHIVTIYVNKEEWAKIPEEEKDLILSIFIYQQIEELRGLPSQTRNELTDAAFFVGPPFILRERN